MQWPAGTRATVGAAVAILPVVLAVGVLGGTTATARAPDFRLTAICGDYVPDPSLYLMRLRNRSAADQHFSWRDTQSGQSGSGTAPAGTDTFFGVQNAESLHVIIVFIRDVPHLRITNARDCSGTLTVTKEVLGDLEPPGASYRVHVAGDSGFEATATLTGGGSQSFTVPGTIATRSAPIGQTPGGYVYTISELDGLGANVSVTPDTLTFNAAGTKTSAVVNQFGAPPPIPPTPGPIPPTPGPPGTADLVLRKDVAPVNARVGDVVTYTVRVENKGPATAVAVTARDIPRRNHPNQVAEVLGIDPSQGTCTNRRPVTCEFGDIPPGGAATLTARVRPGVTGTLQNLAEVSSLTPDPNPSNNQETAGLSVSPGPAKLRLSKSVERDQIAAGETVPFTLTVESRGPETAVGVEVCDRLPQVLRVKRAKGAAVADSGRQACWTVRSLAEGKAKTFRLRARARGSITSASGEIVNTATATAENAARRRARAGLTSLGTTGAGAEAPAPNCRAVLARC